MAVSEVISSSNSTILEPNGLDSSALLHVIHQIGHLSSSGVAWFYVGFVANIIFLGVVFFLERATSKATGHMK